MLTGNLFDIVQVLSYISKSRYFLKTNIIFLCIQVSNRERKMGSLQSQLHDLHKEISRRDSEITTHQQTIKMMQEKQRYLSGEVSQHFMILPKKSLAGKNVAYQKIT